MAIVLAAASLSFSHWTHRCLECEVIFVRFLLFLLSR